MEVQLDQRVCCRFRKMWIEGKCQKSLREEKGEEGIGNVYRIWFDLFNKDCLECNDFYHQKITKRIDAKKNILCCELTYVLETQWKNAFQRYNFCKEKLLDSDKTAIAYYNYSLISEYNHNVLSYLKKNDSLNCAKCIDFLEILEKHKKG